MKNYKNSFKDNNILPNSIESILSLNTINVLLSKIEEGKDIDRLDILMIEIILEEYRDLLLKSDDKNN